MKTLTKEDLSKFKDFAKIIIKDQFAVEITQHDWKSTKKNVKTLKELMKQADVDQYTISIAIAATYFLYTGFGKQEEMFYENSEAIAKEYLEQRQYHQDVRDDIISFLQLKSKNNKPESLGHKIFLDMAFAYYGQKGIIKRISKTWEERNFIKDDRIDLITYMTKKIGEIENHSFYSLYAKQRFNYKKNTNLLKLKAFVDKVHRKNNLSSNKTAMTMFKTALRNHIDLVNIADKKAGIMISINAILMTIMIPILGSYIIDISRFIIPSMILIFTCGAAVILATLATRPTLSSGDIGQKDKVKGEKSLFYFGNFFNMDKEDYRNAVKDVIVRDISLENSIINDLYDIGYILGIKYKRLRLCYIIFAIGIGLTLISFVISYLLIPGF